MSHKATRTVQGVLQVLGSLTGNDKKYESFIVRVSDGELAYFTAKTDDSKKKDKKKDDKKKKDDSSEIEGVLDIIPLTGASLDVVTKKEKPATDYAFAIVGAANNKKWRTIFCTDSEENLNKWKDGISKSIDLATSNVFGTTIEDACYKANKHVPAVMEACINNIDQNLKTEGLFRVPGDKMKIELFVQMFNRGESPDFAGEEVHLVCSLLKAYLSDLRDPLVPFDMYKAFIAASNAKEDVRLAEIKALVAKLPEMNRIVLSYLIAFLGRVQVENAHNRMDFSNLGVVFGPTVIRNNRNEEAAAKATSSQGLEEMASSNRLIEIFIKQQKEIFNPEDFNLATTPVYDADLKAMKQRDVMSAAEKAAVEAFIKLHAPPKTSKYFENTVSFMVNLRNQKTKELEPRIVVADAHRLYVFFKGGKEELHFHYLDIKDITSLGKASATIMYQTPADKTPNNIEIHPISYGASDIDVLIRFINTQYEQTFIGRLPSEKFTLTLKPADRAERIMALPAIDADAQCGGMVKAYISVCDWKGSAVHEDIIWDLENYFAENQFKKFAITEVMSKESKFPNSDYDALMYALSHNLWFTELSSAGAVLGSESFAPALADCFKFNRRIQTLDLKDAKADSKGVTALLQAFIANQNLAITKLTLSGNEIDVKATSVLCEALEKSLSKLVSLDVSSTQLNKKAIPQLMQTLAKSATLTQTLTELNLSDNKFDEVCSLELGKFLAKTKTLATLKLASTGVNYTKAIDGMIEGTNLVQCASLKTIDLSENPIKLKQASELVSFCKYLPSLTSLNVAAATAGQQFADSLVEMLTNNPLITDLDISDIDLTDDGFITFLNFLSKEEGPKIPLQKFTMNYAFHKSSKTRPEAMRAVARTLNSNQIREFYFKGGKGNALKNDLLDMVFGLMNNNYLEILDISGHQGGDAVATGIGKVLQHNNVLHTIFLDSNLITLPGLNALKLGLSRNKTVKHMPLPLVDISILIKDNEELATKIFAICKDIQKKLYENQCIREDLGYLSLDDGSKTPRVSVSKSSSSLSSSTSVTPKAGSKATLKVKEKERNSKRRSIYDENKAAALFGGHAVSEGEMSSEVGAEEGSASPEADAEASSEVAAEGSADGSHASGEKPKLAKSNSQQVLQVNTSKSPSASPAIGRSSSNKEPTSSPRDSQGVSRSKSVRKESSKDSSSSKSKSNSMLKMSALPPSLATSVAHSRRASAGVEEAPGDAIPSTQSEDAPTDEASSDK